MRMLITLILIGLIVVIATILAINNPGTVWIEFGENTLQLPLSYVLVALVAGFVALYFLIRATLGIKRLPGRMGHFFSNKRRDKSRLNLNRGFTEMAEGRWLSAEKALMASAPKSETPLLNYLGAARCAQHRHDDAKRDEYLEKAADIEAESGIALGLTRAELQQMDDKYEESLATLELLHQKNPSQELVQIRLARALGVTGDFERLKVLLPMLEKNKIIDAEERKHLATSTYTHLLDAAGLEKDRKQIEAVWRSIGKTLQGNTDIKHSYVRQLIRADDAATAGPFIRKSVKAEWDDTLVAMYSELNIKDHKIGLAQCEKWLKLHPKSPGLLATAGYLNARAELWGRARSLLEESLRASPHPHTYLLMGQLLEKIDAKDEALHYYREGVRQVHEQDVGEHAVREI